MITFLDFLRFIYAPTYWIAASRFATVENYAASVVKYVEAVGNPPINELNPQNAACSSPITQRKKPLWKRSEKIVGN